MYEEQIDFSKQFRHDIKCTYPNICGTKQDLLDYFDKEIVGNRKLVLSDGMTLEKQVQEISRTKGHQGVVAFMFAGTPHTILETQGVYVHSRRIRGR